MNFASNYLAYILNHFQSFTNFPYADFTFNVIQFYGMRSLLFGAAYFLSKAFSTTKALHRVPMYAQKSSQGCADVYLVPMFNDNYGHVLVDRETKMAAVIDPGEPQPVIDFINSQFISLSYVLCTHKHGDHSGGNLLFKKTFSDIDVIATQYEAIPGATKLVGEGDQLKLGSLTIDVIYTPCHTRGHVIYIVTGTSGDPILFTGDTLFVGGCGRFFEGTALEMLNNMDKLSTYPPNSQIYCAHEYTETNYKFLNSIASEICGERYQEVVHIRSQNQPTVPSTLADELQYNLFMRCHDIKIQSLLHTKTAEDTMATLRTMKNNF